MTFEYNLQQSDDVYQKKFIRINRNMARGTVVFRYEYVETHCSRLAKWYERVYIYWSFGFLILRTVTMSLSVTSINDESHLPKSVLFAVPTGGYNVEVSDPRTVFVHSNR
jgi:hypothetical protein